MSKSKRQPQTIYTEAAPARRKLAAAFRERAADPRYTKAERAEWNRMAAAWERTLPDNNSVK